MSALTKIFVVLLVVVSLLSAAGFIVFVNRVDNFKMSLATAQAKSDQLQGVANAARAETQSVVVRLDAARKDLTDANAENARIASDSATQVAKLNSDLAAAASQARIAGVATDNITAALKASEESRGSVNTALASARTELDALNKTKLEDEIAISSFTNQVDVLRGQVTNFQEELAQTKADNDRLNKLAKDRGIPTDTTAAAGTGIGAPPINGYVVDTKPINGIPYATISVGSAESVTKGMVFQVIDRDHAKYLGELTVDTVDLHNATGKLEGPSVSSIRKGQSTEVKTQL